MWVSDEKIMSQAGKQWKHVRNSDEVREVESTCVEVLDNRQKEFQFP